MADGDHTNIKYGELIVLGYNGMYTLCNERNHRTVSRFTVYKRHSGNGVSRGSVHVVKAPKHSQVVLDNSKHSISFTLNKNKAVVVEYNEDPATDMFQIGRSSEPQINFTVVDTWLGVAKDASEVHQSKLQSTISRYACRILIDRDVVSHTPRLFAAGFDSSRNVYLGIEDETNMLTDGTLIDLCGATLLWRSADGLAQTPTRKQLESRLDEVNAGRPQCPVNLNTLIIPRGRVPKITSGNPEWIPFVYFGCGHVQGKHGWGHKEEGARHECPLCYTESDLIAHVSMGMESTFHLDSEKPSHAFKPCGHMASERTVRYWSRIPLPQGSSSFCPVCPFCTVPLDPIKPYVRIILQDNCDA